MKVSINKNLGAHSPFSEGSTIEEKAKIMRFKYPKACSSIETGAMAFATMVEDVKDAEAWKFIGFDTFEEFCQEELGRTINEVEDIVTGVKILGGNPTERQAKTASRSATAAKLVEAGTHNQSEAAREVGISREAVRQVVSSKSSYEEKSLDMPEHVKGNTTQATFRKLPEELQEQVVSKQKSVRAAGIEAGVIVVPTPLEKAQKAYDKLTDADKSQFQTDNNLHA